MPQLIIFIIIVILIKIANKQTETISSAIWLPTTCLLLSCSKDLGFYFNLNTNAEQGSLPERILLLLLGFLSIVVLFKRKPDIGKILRRNYTLLIILSYMLISILWSEWPNISFRRWGKEIIAIIIMLVLISEKQPIDALIGMIRRFIYIALPVSLILIRYYPQYGREFNVYTGEIMWTGIASQKNGLALMCSFSIIFFIWSLWADIQSQRFLDRSFFRRLIDVMIVALAIYLMMGPRRSFTYSSTSFFVLLVGIVFLLSFKNQSIKNMTLNKKHISAMIISIIITGTLIPFLGKIPLIIIPSLLQRSEDLTGRTHLWEILIPYAKNNLLIGHGYGGFWNTYWRERISVSAHNGYLDTILNIGVIGLVLFSLFFIRVSNIKPKSFENEFILLLTMIFMLLIHNISESSWTYILAFPNLLIISFSIILNSVDNNNLKNNL